MEQADDQKRFFIFASSVCEVVIPIFRQRLCNHFTSQGFPDFQAFINHQPICHKLFHLVFKGRHCCSDTTNCYNNSNSPMMFYQWNILYDGNTTSGCTKRNVCHCKFMAKQVILGDLDLTLASLILFEVCNLPLNEVTAVQRLREFKNKFLSHNVDGCIRSDMFDDLWDDLMTDIFTLDPNRQDELTRIRHRPLDARLCEKYRIDMMDIHKKLNEIDEKLDQNNQKLDQQNSQLSCLPDLYQRIDKQHSQLSCLPDLYQRIDQQHSQLSCLPDLYQRIDQQHSQLSCLPDLYQRIDQQHSHLSCLSELYQRIDHHHLQLSCLPELNQRLDECFSAIPELCKELKSIQNLVQAQTNNEIQTTNIVGTNIKDKNIFSTQNEEEPADVQTENDIRNMSSEPSDCRYENCIPVVNRIQRRKKNRRQEETSSVYEEIDLSREQIDKCINDIQMTDNVFHRKYHGQGISICSSQFKEIDLEALPGVQIKGQVSDVLIINDGRIILCMSGMNCLLICNNDGTSVYTILLEGSPCCFTTTTENALAVTLPGLSRVVVYDINSRIKLRTIHFPGWCYGITAITNRLVVGGNEKLWMLNHQTGKIIKTIETSGDHRQLQASGDNFFSNAYQDHLTCYNKSGKKLYTTTSLPSNIRGLTSLKDGSLCVTCGDAYVYHLSFDGKTYQPLRHEVRIMNRSLMISYNQNRQQLALCQRNGMSGLCRAIRIFDVA